MKSHRQMHYSIHLFLEIFPLINMPETPTCLPLNGSIPSPSYTYACGGGSNRRHIPGPTQCGSDVTGMINATAQV